MAARLVRWLALLVVIVLVFELGIVAAGVLRADSAAPHSSSALRLVALGDSLTRADGLGDASWYSLLAGSDARTVGAGNAGVNGNTTAQMLARLDSDALALSPNLVVVMGGTNDLSQGVAADITISNLRTIVERIKARGSKVVLATIPPRIDPGFAARTRALSDRIRALAASLDVPLADVYSAVAATDGTLPPELTSDGLHLSRAGNLLVAGVMYRAVAPLL